MRMNRFFLVAIFSLLILSSFLLFLYRRDVLLENDEVFVDECTPVNLQIKDVLSTSFIVEWETAEECLGVVKYGESVDSVNLLAIDNENNFARKTHSIRVENLKSSSIYYIVVFSDGVEYGVEGTPVIVNTKAF